jgi:uncharacterized membrane protein
MRAGASALLALVLVAVVWSLLHVGWYTHHHIVDTPVYQNYGIGIVTQHLVPYRDFEVEYPPAALPLFAFPSLFKHSDYRPVFELLMALCHMTIVYAVARLAGWRAAVAAGVAPLALGSLVLSRFDFWPAALAVLALLAVLRGRLAVSALLLGTAFAAKLWPALLAPFILVWLVRTRGRRDATLWSAVAVGVAAAWFLPFAIIAPAGVAHSFHAQLARPLQLESLGGAVLLALHHVAGTQLRMVSSFGSQNLVGPGTHAAAVATTVVGAVALLGVWIAFARRPADRDTLFSACAAAVAVTIAFGKVFSPQFLIWLIPLVPLVRRALPTVLFGLALVLTQLYFPREYWRLALDFAPTQSWELLARDLVVVAVAAALASTRLQHEVLGKDRARLEALKRVRAQIE